MEAQRVVRMTYDVLKSDTGGPKVEAGRYLVSIGKKGVGTVWLIRSAIQVKKKDKNSEFNSYRLELVVINGVKELVEYERVAYGANVWVRGEEALPLFWYPR